MFGWVSRCFNNYYLMFYEGIFLWSVYNKLLFVIPLVTMLVLGPPPHRKCWVCLSQSAAVNYETLYCDWGPKFLFWSIRGVSDLHIIWLLSPFTSWPSHFLKHHSGATGLPNLSSCIYHQSSILMFDIMKIGIKS